MSKAPVRAARFLAGPVLAAILAGAPPSPALAQKSTPVAMPVSHGVPDAVDTPYPGVITLDVDATDTTRATFRVTETIPVAEGTTALVLQLPQWIPGHHAPVGTIEELIDLRFKVDGQPIRWWRDPVEVFAFHLDLPPGTRAVEASFVHTPPQKATEALVAGRVSMTDEIVNLQWDRMSLYPAGHYVRQIRVVPRLRLPSGWGVASALDGRHEAAGEQGNQVSWAETDYETLVDSPVMAGAHFRREDLGQGVSMNLLADKPGDLAITPEHLAAYRALVDEGLALFGARHFDHYDFLVALTDRLGGIGLEHHRSSENAMAPRALVDWAEMDWDRNVVAHEFTHSWNGKYRRPAELWTPDYRQPMRDNLLWVYEGQTQLWGLVLAARAGMRSHENVLGEIASYAGQYTQWPGRGWRSVADTTLDPIIDARRPKPWPSLDRNEDYYTEGALVWLEVDQILREGTGGRRGLDDFARAFFGGREGDWGEVPYGAGDVAAALNALMPYDWAGFFAARIGAPAQPSPLAGIEKGGYRLVWREEPNPFDRGKMAHGKNLNLFHSLGVNLDHDGKVLTCRWDSPAFNAGLVPGERIVAAGGVVYDHEAMRAAITAAKPIDRNVELIVQRGDKVFALAIPYHDGLRWPWLERVNERGAGLDALLAPRRARR